MTQVALQDGWLWLEGGGQGAKTKKERKDGGSLPVEKKKMPAVRIFPQTVAKAERQDTWRRKTLWSASGKCSDAKGEIACEETFQSVDISVILFGSVLLCLAMCTKILARFYRRIPTKDMRPFSCLVKWLGTKARLKPTAIGLHLI